MTRPIRVAVVTTGADPDVNELWVAAHGQSTDLLLIAPRELAQSVPCVMPMVTLPYRDFGRGLIYRRFSGLKKALDSFRPDLVHVNGEAWCVPVLQVARSGHSFVPHGAENIWSHGNRIERHARYLITNEVLRRAAGYASWNSAGASHALKLRGPDFPTLVLPAIIPSWQFRQQPESVIGRTTSDPFILAVGRLVAEKGWFTLIRAISYLEPDRPTLVLCGTGPLDTSLRELSAELGVKLVPRGQVSPSELSSLMSTAKVMVQPSETTASWSEQFGRTVAEGMTCGVPCLVSDSGDLPNVVGNHRDSIFREGDSRQLADMLREVLRSPEKRQLIASRQSQAALRYSPEVAAQLLVNFWHLVLRKP
jgi:glycosyltransferase involved in cell wall biosynthesis